MQLYNKKIQTPVGQLTLVAHDQALVAVLWENDDSTRVKLSESFEQNEHPLLKEVEKQLAEYFAGQRTQF